MTSITIFHNILWSKYKGGVFSAMYSSGLTSIYGVDLQVVQIAETELDRLGLSNVDLSYHRYPHKLLFQGAYGSVPKWLMIKTMFLHVWNSSSTMVLLPGFHAIEYWAMLIAAKMRGKIVGVFCDSTEYDRPRSRIKGFLKRIFFSMCDVFFGYGQRSHDYLRMHGANSKHIYFRCQAAALPHNYEASSIPEQRSAPAPVNRSPRFLYVGRLSPEKGLVTLIRAFALVLRGMPNARLILVGSGPQRSFLEALTEELFLKNNVEFLGAKDVDGLREEYLRASCLLLPSVSEPWGLVVNEALAFGCPVIVSHRCGCVPELVVDGVTGYVFQSGDVDDLVEKMRKIADEFVDPLKTAKNCLSLISTFTPEAAARQILEGCKVTCERLRENV